MSAVRRWLRAGAGSQGVELGRLTNSEHPAVAAAARCAGSRAGVAKTTSTWRSDEDVGMGALAHVFVLQHRDILER